RAGNRVVHQISVGVIIWREAAAHAGNLVLEVVAGVERRAARARPLVHVAEGIKRIGLPPQAAATRARKPPHVIVLVGAGLAVVGAGDGVGNVERGLAAVGVPVVHARVRLAVHAELVLPHAPGVGVIGIAVAIVVSECYPGGAERIVARGPDQRRATGTRRGRPALAIEAIGDARPAGQIKIRRRPVGIGG